MALPMPAIDDSDGQIRGCLPFLGLTYSCLGVWVVIRCCYSLAMGGRVRMTAMTQRFVMSSSQVAAAARSMCRVAAAGRINVLVLSAKV